MPEDHRRKHTYWNIKGCGDAARVSTGKFLFFRGKACGGFCSTCGTNVPPQILPRFSTLRHSKCNEIYGQTPHLAVVARSEQSTTEACAKSVEAPGPPIPTPTHPLPVR